MKNIGGGKLFLLVGNSGSGKDTLIAETLRLWPADMPTLISPQRYITRPAHGSEPFLSISRQDFARLKADGAFLFSWQSYGIDYGAPLEIAAWLDRGHPVLLNVSRRIIPLAKEMLPCTRVVFVFVPLTLSVQRIMKRGREARDSRAFQKRLLRAKANQFLEEADLTVDNSGRIEDGARLLRDYIVTHIARDQAVMPGAGDGSGAPPRTAGIAQQRAPRPRTDA